MEQIKPNLVNIYLKTAALPPIKVVAVLVGHLKFEKM